MLPNRLVDGGWPAKRCKKHKELQTSPDVLGFDFKCLSMVSDTDYSPGGSRDINHF